MRRLLLSICLLALVACESAEKPIVVERLERAPRPGADESIDPVVLEAIEQVATQVDADPNQAALWAELAKFYQANEVFGLAETAWAQALLREPAQPAWWYYRAQVASRSGELERGVEFATKSAEGRPDYVYTWWRRGEMEMELGRIEQAEASYRKGLEVAPGHLYSTLGLARVMLQSDRVDEATALLEARLDEAADEPYLHFLLGDAYRRAGRRDEAQLHLQQGNEARIIRDDGWGNELVRYQVSFGSRIQLATNYINDGQLDVALTLLESLRRRQPDDLRVLTKLGQVHLRRGDAEAALEVLESAREKHPEAFRVYLELAAVHQVARRHDQALANAERAIELNPAQSLAWARKAVALRSLDRYAEAAEAFSAAIERDPREFRLWRSRGDCYSRLQRWKEAADDYRRAIQLDAADAELLVAFGFANFQRGELVEAENALVKAIELGPKRPDRVEALLTEVRRRRAAG